MRVHLVDGTYELFRFFYSKRPPHRDPQGHDRKAVAGVTSSMLQLLNDSTEDVSHIAVAFDNPIESFRNDLFDGYKTSAGVPEELLEQFDPIEEAMRALGVVVWSMDRWECDDALATGAARFADSVDQVRILSPDKDLGQMVRGSRIVTVDRMREKEYDEAGVLAARGVPPKLVPDLLALTGDTADGIPGLDGFGEKTAAALLVAHGSIEAIPDDPAKWKASVRGADRLGATLREHRREALLYKKLATLVTDVPLKEDLEGIRFRGTPRDRFAAWCEETGLPKLAERVVR